MVGPDAEELTSLMSQMHHLQVASMVLESDMLWVVLFCLWFFSLNFKATVEDFDTWVWPYV